MLTGKNPFERRPRPPDTRKGRGSFVRAVGSFVPKIAAKVFEKYGFHSAEIMTGWARVVGPEFASFTQPERMRWPRGGTGTPANEPRPGATLHLRVDPARALDAEYRGSEIIERINRYFGYRAVESLRLIQAPLRPIAQPAAPQPKTNHAAAPFPGPMVTEDPDLKAALEALWANISSPRGKD